MPFNPERLVAARNRRAKSQIALAMECGVDPRNVRRYESGEGRPSDETLLAIARSLGFPTSYFLNAESPTTLAVSEASFRSMSTMTRQQADAALAAGAIAIDLAEYMGDRLTLPTTKLPDLQGAHPEEAARQVRAAWRIGNQPISNVIHLFEKHGIRVFSLVEECREVDAFCVLRRTTPFVFLNTMKSSEHSRFDACHELAHLTLHQSTERRGKVIEQEAHRFAAAFLMPSDDVLAHAPREPSVDSLIRLKRRWGVSVVALVRRLYSLKLLREWQYKQLCIEISRRGYRSKEPLPLPREQSQLLRSAFQLLRSEGVTRGEIAASLDITIDELDRLTFGLQLTSVTGQRQASKRSQASLRLVEGGREPGDLGSEE